MNICLFGHSWHTLTPYEPLVNLLRDRGITFEMLVLAPPTSAYFQSLEEFQRRFPQLSGWERGVYSTRIFAVILRIPLIGPLFAALLFLFIVRRRFAQARYDCIVVSGDRGLFINVILIRAAKAAGVPVLLYPQEAFQSHDMDAKIKSGAVARATVMRTFVRRLTTALYSANFSLVEGAPSYNYVPSYLLPFALWNRIDTLLPIDPFVRGTNPNLSAVAVNSSDQGEEIRRTLGENNRFFVTGFPAFDAVMKQLRMRDQTRTDLLHIRPNQRVLLIIGTHLTENYAPHEFPAAYQEIARIFRLLVDELPSDVLIVYKKHPHREILQDILAIDPALSERMRIIGREADTYQLVGAADAIFMFASSVIGSAIATDARIWLYHLPNLRGFDEFYHPYHSPPRLNTRDELHKVLPHFFDPLSEEEKKGRDIDRRHNGIYDGRNTERIYEAICTVARTS
ncbi:hypothetical protein C4568_02420 [Candidatus Parcubacteria bacterium]|nr:MAG: hypothetical protein C4568_02420 [Candidatus Parcubacteria bacterium]